MKTSPLIPFIILLSLVLVNISLHAQENYEIRKINFTGNDSIDDDLLLDAMVMYPLSYLEKKLTKKEPSLYNEQLLETDLERLTRYYQREGFIDAKVEPDKIKANDNKRKVDLRFKIEQGTPFRVDSIWLTGNTTPNEINIDSVFQSVKAKLQLLPNQRFRDDALTSDLNLIKNSFSQHGYAYAQSDYQLTLNRAEKEVSIHYVITPGPRCHFGTTQLKGNKHTEEKFIRKQLKFKEGDIYNLFLLDESRKNLYKLQLFSVLSIQPELTKQKSTPIPVRIYIEEAPRFTSKYGLGYGTEDKFRAFAELNYKGFPSGAQRLNLQLKHSALNPYLVNFSWIQPQFFNPKLSLTINPFISRYDEPGYQIRDLGFNVRLTDQLSDHLSAQANYYFEKVKNFNAEGDSTSTTKKDIPYNKSGVIFSILYDTSNPKFSPSKGLNIILAYKLNGYAFGGDYDYSRIWTDIRNYQGLGKLVLASRLMVGGIRSGNKDHFIPVEDRFYAGGSNSVRGWQRSELGPLRDTGKPLGGSSVIQGALELRLPLVWKLSAVSFLDFGNVWEDEFKYKLNELAYAGGGGLRFDTPIGPIRFDIGVPLWNQKRSAEFFISVGQAF
jgi:outer membrane protein insertion porin family